MRIRSILVVTLAAFFYATPAAALEVPAEVSAADIVFYTLTLTSIAFFSAGMILTRQFHWLTYSIYGIGMVALIASLDGTFSVWFGGDLWMMSDAPLLIGAGVAAFGFAHIGYRLEPGHWLYTTRKLHLGFAFLVGAIIPLYFTIPTVVPNLVPLYAVLNTGMLIMFTAQVFPPVTWTEFSPTQHRATILWPTLTATVAVGGYALHYLGPGFERETLNTFNRLLIGLHLAHLLVFVSISVIEQIRARLSAEQAAAEAAQAAAEAALALEVSEREFERARSLASNRSRQLATASHDLKQPIAALRQVVERRAEAEAGNDVQRLREAVDYLDQLAGTYLNIGSRDLDASLNEDKEIEHDELGREKVGINVILATVAALYLEEAKASDIDLHTRAGEYEVHVHPLALTRVLSNIVANAIAHSRCTRILLCARRRGDAIRIEVHDNGKGMTETELAEAKQIRVSGADSSGTGLGLAIIQHQADEQGWAFVLKSQPGSGTSNYLTVPASVSLSRGYS